MLMAMHEFTDDEWQLAAQILLERYGRLVPMQKVEAELLLDADSSELTACPALYWSERDAHFVLFKLGAFRYRCQFFYSESEQYGTGRGDYDDLSECLITLLQVQADHERTRHVDSGEVSVEYLGPVMI